MIKADKYYMVNWREKTCVVRRICDARGEKKAYEGTL